jgi:DNA-directed RNA polymerase subunit RPC12/RpoP
MSRKIHGEYYEDDYIKHECQSCRRSFVLGGTLSQGQDLSCPYCGGKRIKAVAAADAETSADMDLGCLGIYYSLYDDGTLMLYTEREFAKALADSLTKDYKHGIPLGNVMDCVTRYCANRDGRTS